MSEWVFLARDTEDRVQFPPTSEVPECFEGQHMWQMGSKLETPWLLYFHSALAFQVYTASQMETEKKCVWNFLKSSLNVLNANNCTSAWWNLCTNIVNEGTTHSNSHYGYFLQFKHKSTECLFTLCQKVRNGWAAISFPLWLSLFILIFLTLTPFLKIVFIVFHPKVCKCIMYNIREVHVYFRTEGPQSFKCHIWNGEVLEARVTVGFHP